MKDSRLLVLKQYGAALSGKTVKEIHQQWINCNADEKWLIWNVIIALLCDLEWTSIVLVVRDSWSDKMRVLIDTGQWVPTMIMDSIVDETRGFKLIFLTPVIYISVFQELF